VAKEVAVYAMIGINIEGKKECLGLWIKENESAKFWIGVLNELKNIGVAMSNGLEKNVLEQVHHGNGFGCFLSKAFPLIQLPTLCVDTTSIQPLCNVHLNGQ